jgi:hypothetical protein
MSQIINCTFIEFHGHMFAKSLINFEIETKFYIKNVEIDNIQTKVFEINIGS